MSAEWKVGDKIVCTAAPRIPNGRVSGPDGVVGHADDPHYPKNGEIYTIRNINPVGRKVILLLDEVRNDHLTDFIRGGLEPGFSAEFFSLVEAA